MGFKGINGQMFFNILYNTAQSVVRTPDLDLEIKAAIKEPGSISEAAKSISRFKAFVESLSRFVEDRKTAPRRGSIPFFVSYFWQIKNSTKWPIYYNP